MLSNGLTSREAASCLNRERKLYLLHGMGEALSVGYGLVTARGDIEVVVIDGDGNALMGLSSWCLLPMSRLHYYVIDNGCYETTGGQRIPSLPPHKEVNVIKIDRGGVGTPNPPSPQEIISDFKSALREK